MSNELKNYRVKLLHSLPVMLGLDFRVRICNLNRTIELDTSSEGPLLTNLLYCFV